MTASFCYKHKARIVLKKRAVARPTGRGYYTYTLVFFPRTHTFGVIAAGANAAAEQVLLGNDIARAAALFETLAAHTVAPCHIADVAADLFEA